jgi:hypothetical protein
MVVEVHARTSGAGNFVTDRCFTIFEDITIYSQREIPMLKINRASLFSIAGLLATVLFAGAIATKQVLAYDHAGHDHAGHDHAAHDHDAGTASLGPHGGQLSLTRGSCFEVFYAPNETRVYIYDSRGQSLSARGIRGQVIMRLRGNGQESRFPLEYVQGSGEDYLAVRVDVSRVRDGDMDAHFELAGLPSRSEPTARFVQTFALSPQLTVTVAELTAADQPAISRQAICPVMADTRLGEHGAPIKLTVQGEPVFVCCKGCIRKVQQNPNLYLAKARQLRGDH